MPVDNIEQYFYKDSPDPIKFIKTKLVNNYIILFLLNILNGFRDKRLDFPNLVVLDEIKGDIKFKSNTEKILYKFGPFMLTVRQTPVTFVNLPNYVTFTIAYVMLKEDKTYDIDYLVEVTLTEKQKLVKDNINILQIEYNGGKIRITKPSKLLDENIASYKFKALSDLSRMKFICDNVQNFSVIFGKKN